VLTSPYREVVEPYLLAERAPHEIAAALGRAPGTVRVQLQRGLERLRRKLPREHASFGLLAGTRGLGGLRAALLEELGVTAGAGPLATHALFAWTALAATPLLWPVPVAASVATLALARPETFPWLSAALTPGAPAPTTEPVSTEDSMKSALLVPLAVLAASPTQDQREPVETASVAAKVAELDALVGELLVLSQPGQTDADAAWSGLLLARNRITQEERARAAQTSTAASRSQSQLWTDAIQQLADAERRAQALREIETALVSGTPDMQLAACRALTACGTVEFDKTPFRPLLLPLARDARGALHTAALYALYNTVHQPEDRALALALADDPSSEARTQGPHLVVMFCDRDLTGDAGAAVARMFTGSTYAERRGMLSGIWGAHVSPELENVVLELSRSQSSEDRYDAMYYSLSTFTPKSEAVVERLIEYLPSTDPNIYQRVLWGLSYGVEPAQGPAVLAAARALFDARSDASIQSDCLGLVGQHAGPELAPWLQGIADDTRRPASVRQAASEALAQVNGR
jgi:hypothetical protein